MNFRIFDGFICLAQCGKRRKLIRYAGNVLCDHIGQGWSGKSKSKARQFEKSTYRWQIMRNFLLEANDRIMFGAEPESWPRYLAELADQTFKREMSSVQYGSRTRHYMASYFKMIKILQN